MALEYIKFAFVCIGFIILAVAAGRSIIAKARRASLRKMAQEMIDRRTGVTYKPTEVERFLSKVTVEDISSDASLKRIVDALLPQESDERGFNR